MLDSYSTIDVFDHGILGADLTSHNHRSEVLVAATYIDLALTEALLKRFVSLSKDEIKGIFDFSKNGPLSTTGSKVTMSYALGIIGKLCKRDLQMIISIRNLFSHSLDYVDFSDPDLIAATEQLYFPKYGHVVVSPKDVIGVDLPIMMNTPQLKFKETCKWLCGELTVPRRPGPITIADEFLYPGHAEPPPEGE